MSDDDKKDIRFSMTIPYRWIPAFYDDLDSAGRYYRAGFVRSVISKVYGADSIENPPTAVPSAAEGGSVDDASADDAMMRAFGGELGLTARSKQ